LIVHRYVGTAGNGDYRVRSGPIWLSNVRCVGTERNIADCYHNEFGVHRCNHSQDVTVSCLTGTL